MPKTPRAMKLWHHHLRDETDAAFLYRVLAKSEPDPAKSEVYLRLASVEDGHVLAWQRLLQEHGQPVPRLRPSLRAKTLALLARWLGSDRLLPVLLEEEGREVKGYLRMYRESRGESAGSTALLLARESAEHADSLSVLSGRSGEPWHKTGAGGWLRSVVYGFNDGLTANFGLVAGMLGAQEQLGVASHTVVVAGIAGMVADALSMGSSGYLAAKSEREVFEHEIAMEREEIRLMPELEREELSLLYQARGLPREAAEDLAKQVMDDPERALREKVREELKIGDERGTPLREAWVTGLSTALGAFLPVGPLLLTTSALGIWTSFALAMLSHFAVGAARSFFTGRGFFRSGMDMFLVGLGVAAVGYVVGEGITRLF